MAMAAKYIKIFTDEMVTLETSNALLFTGIIQSSKNSFEDFENYPAEIQELFEIVITAKIKGHNRLDFRIKLKNIQFIERVD